MIGIVLSSEEITSVRTGMSLTFSFSFAVLASFPSLLRLRCCGVLECYV